MTSKPKKASVQKSLEKDFRALSQECVDAFMSDVSAEATISEKLVKAYILFRRLRNDPLMAKLHQDEGLELPDYTAAWPEFSDYVKITFRLGLQRTEEDKARYAATNSGTRGNKQSGYTAALLRLHVEFEENELRYKHDTEDQLLAFHHEHKGIEGAREWRAKMKTKGVTAPGSSAQAPQQKSITIAEAARAWINRHGLHLICKTTVHIGQTRTCPGDVQFDADGLGLVIAQRHGLRYFDVANDDLKGIAQKSATRLKHVSQPGLRALSEVVRTQLYPKQFAPLGSRHDPASAYCKWEKKLLGAKSQRYILLKGAEMILSATNQTAGLVTIVEPTMSLMPPGVVALRSRGDTLPRLEELLDVCCMVGMETMPDTLKLLNGTAVMLLKARRDSGGSSYEAQNGGESRPVGVKFDNADPSLQRNLQPTLDLSSYVAQWSLQASTAWFSEVKSRFLEQWFRHQGAQNRITRDENCRFGLRVDRDALTITYEIDSTGIGPVERIRLGGPTSHRAKLINGGPGVCSVASADFARVCCAMPDLHVRGNVTVTGDDHLILFEFATDVGKFKIGMPSVTVTPKGLVRDQTHMVQV